jgi:hypothetical protein
MLSSFAGFFKPDVGRRSSENQSRNILAMQRDGACGLVPMSVAKFVI